MTTKKIEVDLGSDAEEGQQGFKINEDFAAKHEYKQKRVEREFLEGKFGKDESKWEKALDDDESSSDYGSEDTDANLHTEKVEQKFNTLIRKIKTGDKTLLQVEGEYFQDSDFEQESDSDDKKKKSSKKITLKDVIREDAIKKMKNMDNDSSDGEDEIFKKRAGAGETIAEEQRRLKDEFKTQAKAELDSSDDDDMLIKKPIKAQSDDEEQQILEKPGKKKEIKFETDKDVLEKLYGKGGDQNNTDRFLRDYVINEGWKQKSKNDTDNYQEYLVKHDKEDEDRDEEMDIFEHKHNFRWEEKEGAVLTTHAREAPEESMRRVENKRKTAREEVKSRKEQEKLKRKEEINKLKALKREEILEKLKKAQFIGGYDKKFMEKAEKELNTEFIPDLYDKNMDVIFDEKYYNDSVDDEEIAEQRDIDLNLMNDKVEKIGLDKESSGDSDGIEELETEQFVEKRKQKREKQFEQVMAKSIKKQVDEQETQQGFETWYACDECHHAINSGNYKFDCQICSDFLFCEKCYKKNTKHAHKFKKSKVPKEHKPPENAHILIAQSYMLCQGCSDSLVDKSKRVYTCTDKSCSPDITNGQAIYWCNKCKDSTEHEHKRTKLKDHFLAKEDGDEENTGKRFLDEALQEYYDLDCEDIIGGGQVKTRFQYTSVPKEDFGLTAEEILLLDDSQLNKVVSLKYLRPYRNIDEDGKPGASGKTINEYKLRKLKQEFKEEVENKKKLLKESQLAHLQVEKEEHFGTQISRSKAQKKKKELEKKAKYTVIGKRNVEKEDQQQAEDEVVPEGTKKKQKRLAQYGLN